MFAWRVSDNQVLLPSDAFLNSYHGFGEWHAITLQWCFHSNKMSIISHSYVSAFWLHSLILRCGLDGTPMFWNAKPVGRDNEACCACARFPDGALGKIIVARKYRVLAGCKREGAVCICETIILLDLVFHNKWTIRAQKRWVILLCVHMCVHISIYLNFWWIICFHLVLK